MELEGVSEGFKRPEAFKLNEAFAKRIAALITMVELSEANGVVVPEALNEILDHVGIVALGHLRRSKGLTREQLTAQADAITQEARQLVVKRASTP